MGNILGYATTFSTLGMMVASIAEFNKEITNPFLRLL